MAQYRDLADYITQRAKAFELNDASLSEALGFGRSYINSVINGQFQPSQRRCRKIASFFGDDPNIILALAGYYEPPRNGEPHLRDIEQTARSLPPTKRLELLEYAKYLKERAIPPYQVNSAEVEEEEVSGD